MASRRLALAAALPLLAAPPAQASKPCGPGSFLFDPAWTRADHTRMAAWVAEGLVVRRVERSVPYPNCALEDRTKCARWDQSVVTVRVERWVKGTGPAELHLTAEWCAPAPPAAIGGRWRFYGREGFGSFALVEPLEAPPPPPRAP